MAETADGGFQPLPERSLVEIIASLGAGIDRGIFDASLIDDAQLFIRVRLIQGFTQSQIEDELIGWGLPPGYAIDLTGTTRLGGTSAALDRAARIARAEESGDATPVAVPPAGPLFEFTPESKPPEPGRYQRNRSRSGELASYAMALLGALGAAVGFGVEWRYWNLRLRGETTVATVVAVDERIVAYMPSRLGTHPIIERGFHYTFSTPAGEGSGWTWIRVGETRWLGTTLPEIGEQLPIVYRGSDRDRNAPSSALYHAAFDSSFRLFAAIDCLGLLAIVIGLPVGLWKRRNRLRRMADLPILTP